MESGISIANIKSERRIPRFVFARSFFVMIARENGYSYPQIGDAINRDHSSIMHLYKKAKLNSVIIAMVQRRMGINFDFDSSERAIKARGPYREIYEKYGGKCFVCKFDEIVEVHHIVPRALGGKNNPENLILLCPNHHAMADRGMLSIKDLSTN